MSVLASLWKRIWNPITLEDVLQARAARNPRPKNILSIGVNDQKRVISNGKNTAFDYQYVYPHTIPFNNTKDVMGKKYHPFYQKFHNRYSQIDADAMWASFRAAGLMGISKKSIVRNKERSRMRFAFRTALLQSGLNRDGRRLDDTNAPSPLKGSIIIIMKSGCLEVPTSSLIKSFRNFISRTRHTAR